MKALKGVSQSAFTPSIVAENRFLPQYMAFSSAPTTAGVNGTLTATGTAASSIHVTGLSISTALLNVGMAVTATNLPAGATIAKIVSATAFDLSVATTGAIGTMTFSGAVVQLKSFKLTVDANIEDDEVLGNVAPVDFLNKEFKVEGQLEAVWQNESDFKTVALATPNVGQALLVDIKNTDVTHRCRAVAPRSEDHARPGLLHGILATDQDQGSRVPNREVQSSIQLDEQRDDEHRDDEHNRNRIEKYNFSPPMSEPRTRPQREITTPLGHKVVVKDYLTAREVNGVLTELFKSQEISAEDKNPRLSLIVGIQRNVKLVEAAVVSLDNSTETCADRLQDLPVTEYTAILNEVKGLADGNF